MALNVGFEIQNRIAFVKATNEWVVEQPVIIVVMIRSCITDSFETMQYKLTNCGTKAADVLDKFLAGKHNANAHNILVYFQLQCLHNSYQFKVLLNLRSLGRNMEG